METVTRLRDEATGLDAYNNPVVTTVETAIPGAAFAPEQASAETVEVGRQAVLTQPAVYFPGAWPDIVRTDRLRVRGVLYDVDGDPADWRFPFAATGPGGLVVSLKRAEG